MYEEKYFLIFEERIKDYSLMWVPAVKKSKFGRASEGLIMGINKLLIKNNNVRFCTLIHTPVVEVIFDVNNNYYIVPVYLNFNNWSCDFEKLYTVIDSTPDSRFILIGDFNCRVGDSQVIPKDLLPSSLAHSRLSKDVVINANGKMLLSFLEDFNLLLLNGRTKGDSLGEFTYISSQGSSVIDLCVVSADLLDYVLDFQVASIPFSDHMPIVLKCGAVSAVSADVTPLLPKLKWKVQIRAVYHEELQRTLGDVSFIPDNPHNNLKQLINLIINFAKKLHT